MLSCPGVDPETQAWTFDLVHAEFRFSDEDLASVAKYNLSDEQKATFMNGILDLCNYVCSPASQGRSKHHSISGDLSLATLE